MGTIFKSGIAYLGTGGGNANQEELTWDEYEALTEEEKTNGTVYYITDADEIEPDKFRPVIYSEDEREIGVWIDGRPLYQKTWIFSSTITGNVNTWVSTGIDASDMSSIVNLQVMNKTDDQMTAVLDYYGATIYEGNVVKILSTRSSGVYVDALTLQYTKKSDFAGSGKWTPQGIPAKHYSTDEQVIGTWIDGKTLYEKTYTDVGQIGTETNTLIDANIKSNSGIYSVKSITGLWSIGNFGYSDATIQSFGETGVFSSGSQTMYARVTPNGLVVTRTNTNFGFKAFLTIRYTKTTD